MYGCSYFAMKIMLNNDKQFIKSCGYGYLDIVKLLIENGANIRDDLAILLLRIMEIYL